MIARVVVSVVAAVVLVVGCAQKQDRTRTDGTGATVQPDVTSDPAQRVSELRRRADELAAAAQRMPGRSASEDRALAAEAFDKAASALELLGGPNPGGAFRQQVRIIDNTRNFLRTGSESIAMEPSVDSGLRSVQGALVGVQQRLFPDDPEIQKRLDALAARVRELDTVRGPLHSLVTAQTFEAASQVVDAMAQQMEGRTAAAGA